MGVYHKKVWKGNSTRDVRDDAIHYDYNLLLTMALMYKLTLLSFVGCVLH
jgi:hypothetical protein